MHYPTFRTALLCLALLLPGALPLAAQEFRAALTGRVSDPAGAALPGAAVSLKNVETNISANAITNADGSFNFALLQPGKYALRVKLAGFKQAARENIVLGVADRVTLDLQLEVGGTSESVTVSAEAAALETNSVGTGMVVTGQQIAELPLTEGTAYQLATLAPGIAYTGNPQFNGPTSNGNLSAFRSNGATGRNQITLDGAPNYAFDGGVGFSPPSDAVQEFKVQTNLFDAQQGYSAGGTVNVAVKSGTNTLHGSLWYFNRDRSRTANNFFSNRSGQERPERTYHRFGGVLHGPVYLPKLYNGRNRTFFLVSYERLKDSIAEPQLFTVPTAKMRKGDFSDLLGLTTPTLIYDPATAVLSGTTVNRTAFANNVIPTQRLNPVAVAYLNFYPQPNTAGNADGTNNYFSNMIRRQNYRAYLTRLDHKISESQTIFGKYYHSFNPEDRYDWAGVINNYAVTSGFEYRTNDGGNVDYTVTLNPSTVLDVRVNFNRFAQERRPAEAYDPAQLGFTPQALAVMRGYRYMPRFDIRTYDATRPVRSTLGSNRSDYNGGLLRPFMMGSFQPTLTKIIGQHTTKTGYDLRVLRENFTSAGYQGGRFFFDGTYTTPASNSSTALRQLYGRDVAAFLLGIPTASTSQSVIENGNSYSVQSVYHGFYFHDDWRVSTRLTLNLGLRYELELGITERFNRIARGFDATTNSTIEAAAQAAYTTAYNAAPANFPLTPDKFRVVGGITYASDGDHAVWNADKSNWQPRAGASFKLNHKTVLRGGFGIFMAPFQVETPYQVGFSGTTPFIASNDNGRTFAGTLSNPFPTGLLATPGASNGLLTNVGQDLGSSGNPIIPAERRNAKFARAVFGVQRELPGQLIVEANFITAWGYDLGVSRNLNFVPRSFLGTDPTTDTAANTFLATTITNPFRNLLGSTGSPFNTATTITRAQSLVAYPQFTNVWVQQYAGTNRYRSLQLQAQKRLARDLTFTGTYTWSSLREQTTYLNPSDNEFEDRLSPDDRPQRYTFSGTYQLPVGRGKHFGKRMNKAANGFIGGWQLNGTYEWQIGEPFALSSNIYSTVDVTKLEGRVGQQDAQGHKYGVDVPAIDVAGLVRLSGFGLRNVPTTLGNLRNQPYLNVNLSLSKNFNLGERRRLQLRGEFLNAFNRTYFSGITLDPSNASFGFVTTQRNNPRDVQLGARFTF